MDYFTVFADYLLSGTCKNRQIVKFSDAKVKYFVVIFLSMPIGPVTGFRNSAKPAKPSVFKIGKICVLGTFIIHNYFMFFDNFPKFPLDRLSILRYLTYNKLEGLKGLGKIFII